ncbi:MAG: CpsB/CapC family capsule biosynthesis tyrosine phosphatase [Polyangia bacterium]|jgi:protein-tyrosine phosphatase
MVDDRHVAHYIDLHCHLLPGLDDGAPDLSTSMAMLEALAELGFAEVYATPHQRNGFYIPTAASIEEAIAQLAPEASATHPEFRLRRGAENYWDEILIERLRNHTVPGYDGQRAFLFEVNPTLLPPHIEEALFEIRLGGQLPVMAHPERYLAVQRDLGLAERLSRQTALVVDLESIARSQHRVETKTARRLVEEGLASAVASDLHTPASISSVAGGIDWIAKHMGADALTRLLEENPRRIVAGELP